MRRWFLVVALGVIGCHEPEHEYVVRRAGSGSAAVASPSSATGWDRVEELARPDEARGSSAELERAIALAKKNHDAWSPLHYAHPAHPLADYADGAEAVAAVIAWSAARGDLPALGAPTDFGPSLMAARDAALLAIDTATPDHRDGARAGMDLGERMVRGGRNLLEYQVGKSLQDDAARKLHELDPAAPADAHVVPDLVRVLAAEALWSRRMNAYATSADGHAALETHLATMDPDVKKTVEHVTGVAAKDLIPTDEQSRQLDAFWLAALAGATRGEPAATTLARVHAAADGAGPDVKLATGSIVRMLDMIQTR